VDSGSHCGVPLAEKCAVDPNPPSRLSPLVKDRASEVDINKDPLPTVNTQGIMWLPDPVGFLAPFIIRAKLKMQEMWVAGLERDEL